MLHTENVARGGKLSFHNVGGGGAKMLTLQESREDKSSPRGEKPPPPTPRCSLLCLYCNKHTTPSLSVDEMVAMLSSFQLSPGVIQAAVNALCQVGLYESDALITRFLQPSHVV